MAEHSSIIAVKFTTQELFDLSRDEFETDEHNDLRQMISEQFPSGITIRMVLTFDPPTIH